MNGKFLVGVGIVTSLALGGAQQGVRAQETPQAEIAANEWQVREIAVKNVPVRMMVWWLDAEHNAAPISVQQANANNLKFGASKLAQLSPALTTLPPGVKSVIVASDARNSLMVVGNPSGMAAIEAALQKFDKPLRQIEVEAQALQISAADAKALGLKFVALDGEINAGRKTPITLARTSDSAALRHKMRDLIFQNKAKIIRAPRVTAINGLTTSLNSQEAHPLLMNFDRSGEFPTLRVNQRGKKADAIFYLTTATGLTVTPTINDNHTVTLDLMPAKTLHIGTPQLFQTTEPPSQANAEFFNPYAESTVRSPSGSNTASMGTLEGFRYQLTVKDDEIVAFGGVSSALYAKTGDKTPPTNIILLVTARILPRFGGEETPGN